MQIKIKSKKIEKKSQKKSVRHTPNGFFVSLSKPRFQPKADSNQALDRSRKPTLIKSSTAIEAPIESPNRSRSPFDYNSVPLTTTLPVLVIVASSIVPWFTPTIKPIFSVLPALVMVIVPLFEHFWAVAFAE